MRSHKKKNIPGRIPFVEGWVLMKTKTETKQETSTEDLRDRKRSRYGIHHNKFKNDIQVRVK